MDEKDGLVWKDGYKDRCKYIVVIGFTPEGMATGALWVNFEMNRRSEELMNCQYPLLVRDYPGI